MKEAANGLSARRWVLLALVAVLGLTIVGGAGSAGASGPGHATAAKKCKKHKRSAAASKKKKCKKLTPVRLPAPGPLVRATLSWTDSAEVDLHAFDASGNQSGWVPDPVPTGSIIQGIPNATHGPDVGPGGPSETFTDNIFVVGGPSNREFSYAACLYDTPSTATFTGVASNGQTSSVPLTGPGGYSLTVPGGPPVPSGYTCP